MDSDTRSSNPNHAEAAGPNFDAATMRGEDSSPHAAAPKMDFDASTMRGQAPVRAPQAGILLANRYLVIAELGQGGMGVVYRCLDKTGGVEVALKALPPELARDTGEMEEVRENFQLVYGLVHTNIAAVRTLERFNGDCYLVMELVQGEDLRHWMRSHRTEDGGVPLEEALPILRQVADALDFAHARRVMHRDIKPSNIMLTPEGLVKILDFGLAAQIHTSLSRLSMGYHGMSGTTLYMSPEQWRGRVQGASVDQYALAALAYEPIQ